MNSFQPNQAMSFESFTTETTKKMVGRVIVDFPDISDIVAKIPGIRHIDPLPGTALGIIPYAHESSKEQAARQLAINHTSITELLHNNSATFEAMKLPKDIDIIGTSLIAAKENVPAQQFPGTDGGLCIATFFANIDQRNAQLLYREYRSFRQTAGIRLDPLIRIATEIHVPILQLIGRKEVLFKNKTRSKLATLAMNVRGPWELSPVDYIEIPSNT